MTRQPEEGETSLKGREEGGGETWGGCGRGRLKGEVAMREEWGEAPEPTRMGHRGEAVGKVDTAGITERGEWTEGAAAAELER